MHACGIWEERGGFTRDNIFKKKRREYMENYKFGLTNGWKSGHLNCLSLDWTLKYSDQRSRWKIYFIPIIFALLEHIYQSYVANTKPSSLQSISKKKRLNSAHLFFI